MEQNRAISDSTLLVQLTLGELREMLRMELQAALATATGSNTTQTDTGTGTTGLSHQPYLSVSEAAAVARVAPSTIRLYIRRGQLKPKKVGRRVIVARSELERFLGSQASKVTELYPI